MRSVATMVLGATLALGACVGPARDDEPAGPPLLPGGYQVVLDGDRQDPGHFLTEETPDGIRFTTGPAGIAWRPADTVLAGDFRAEATLTLQGAPVGYREAYGIFVGGEGLGGPTSSYLYLLVRTTGEFAVKRRVGSGTETLVEWMSHNAVQRVTLDGDTPVNTLAVEVLGEETRFLVNGTVVFLLSTAEAGPYGAAGLRVNHRLDLLLTEWSLGPPPPPEPATSAP